MSIKKFLNLGGDNKSKLVMEAKVRSLTGREDIVELCSLVWDLVVSTDYLRDSVYGVVVQGMTHDQSSEEYGVKKSYLRNLVGREDKRLEDDIIVNILDLSTGSIVLDEEVVGNIIILTENLIQNSKPKDSLGIYAKFTIPMGDVKLEKDIGGELGDDVIVSDMKELRLLSKKQAMTVKETRSRRLGYYLYLLQTDDSFLSDTDKARKAMISDLWWVR